MVLYHRNRVPGATYFFTVALRDRTSRVLTAHVEELRRAYAGTRSKRPFETVALVILPDHIHAIWRLPEGDADYSGRWRAIKAAFVLNLWRNGVVATTNARREAGVWQRRFWEHTIRNEAGLRAHVDYVHWNPVKHEHVECVSEWPHSSFHRYVREGVLPNDWGGTNALRGQGRSFGE